MGEGEGEGTSPPSCCILQDASCCQPGQSCMMHEMLLKVLALLLLLPTLSETTCKHTMVVLKSFPAMCTGCVHRQI